MLDKSLVALGLESGFQNQHRVCGMMQAGSGTSASTPMYRLTVLPIIRLFARRGSQSTSLSGRRAHQERSKCTHGPHDHI